MMPVTSCFVGSDNEEERPLCIGGGGNEDDDELNRTVIGRSHVPSCSRIPLKENNNKQEQLEKCSDFLDSRCSINSNSTRSSDDDDSSRDIFGLDDTQNDDGGETNRTSTRPLHQRDNNEENPISVTSTTTISKSQADCDDEVEVEDFSEISKQAKMALHSLTLGSTFFKFNKPRKLPTFQLNEVKLGNHLGQGEFGTVWQVNQFLVTDSGDSNTEEKKAGPLLNDTEISCNHHDVDGGDDLEDEDDLTMQVWEAEDVGLTSKSNNEIFNSFDSPAQLKSSMIRNVDRNGLPRYALKQVRQDLLQLNQKQENNSKNNANNNVDSSPHHHHLVAAVIDLAREAKMLRSLNHSNICKIRAMCGEPGSPDFSIVIDCMPYGTLRERIKLWTQVNKAVKGQGFLGKFSLCQGSIENDYELQKVYSEQLNAVLDISRGMEYLHSKHIIYRDLKPDNIGLNVRGDVRIFDFGLAKELRVRDLVCPPDGYNATGMAGTRRYMAPEVAKGLLYGLPADVYSFSILAWQVLTLQTPYDKMTPKRYVDQVVEKGVRPRGQSIRSKTLRAIVTQGWSADPEKRPDLMQFRRKLKIEVDEGGDRQVSDHSLDKSMKSILQERHP